MRSARATRATAARAVSSSPVRASSPVSRRPHAILYISSREHVVNDPSVRRRELQRVRAGPVGRPVSPQDGGALR